MCKTRPCVEPKSLLGMVLFLALMLITNLLVMNLSVEAPKFDGFSVGSVNNGNVTVYGLAQCWEFVNGTACEDCLANAVSNISSCTPKEGC